MTPWGAFVELSQWEPVRFWLLVLAFALERVLVLRNDPRRRPRVAWFFTLMCICTDVVQSVAPSTAMIDCSDESIRWATVGDVALTLACAAMLALLDYGVGEARVLWRRFRSPAQQPMLVGGDQS